LLKNSKPYIAVLAIMLLGYAIVQGFLFFSKPIKTEKLYLSQADDFIPCEGIIVRNEEIITEKTSGVRHFSVKEGEKVSAHNKLADMYPVGTGSEIYNEIDELDKKIERLEKSTGGTEVSSGDAVKNEQNIKTRIIELAGMSQNRQVSDAATLTDGLRVYFDQKQIISGQMDTLKHDLNATIEKKERLMTEAGASVMRTVYSPKTGYFSQVFDGYENLLNPDFILNEPYDKFKEVFDLKEPSGKPAGYIGKMSSGFTWYIAMTVPKGSLHTYAPGDTLNLRIEGLGNATIPALLERMEQTDDGDYCIFSTDHYTETIARLRRVKVQIVTKTYSGYRVNKAAVRIQDENTGIYTVSGSLVAFRNVNVLFTTDEYCIITQGEGNKSALFAGQPIIVDGKNLFDGKVIK